MSQSNLMFAASTNCIVQKLYVHNLKKPTEKENANSFEIIVRNLSSALCKFYLFCWLFLDVLIYDTLANFCKEVQVF
jgi:hypothetical protein